MRLGGKKAATMARVIWLDDRRDQIERGLRLLDEAGYQVAYCSSEREAVAAIERDPKPVLVIQDLHRPDLAQTQDLSAHAHAAGWIFYKEVLRLLYPEIPVLICSGGAYGSGNRKRADDFNLHLISKVSRAGGFVDLVKKLISGQSRLYEREDVFPAITAVDFEKVNFSLVRHLAKHPEDLDKVSWSSFEGLVKELLIELGYEVLHTPLTRDGGVDLWALLRSDLGEVLYAIDAKKYSRGRVVGPEPVRAIYGVADLAGASAGMIVTTGIFGPEARRLANQHRYRLALKDYVGVEEWIQAVARGERLADV
jgi:CheY-like chemotaxis protein